MGGGGTATRSGIGDMIRRTLTASALSILIGLIATATIPSGRFAEAQPTRTTHSVTPATFGTYFDIDASTAIATLKDAYKSDTTLVFGAGDYRNAMHIEGATNFVLRARNAPDSTSAATLRPRLIVEGIDGSRDALLAVTESTNVTLDRFNFAFDCVYDAPPAAAALWAIFFEDSSGVISNNLLLDMRDDTRGVQNPRRMEETACSGEIGSPASSSAYRVIRVQTSSSYVPDIDDTDMVTNRLPIHITGNHIDSGREVRVGIHVNGYVNATVSDNVVKNAFNALDVQGAASGVVSDNRISMVTGGVAYFPNWFVPNSPDGETVEANLEIRGNNISQASSAGIVIGSGWCAAADGTRVNINAKIVGNYIHGHHDDPDVSSSAGIQIISCAGAEDERIKVDIISNTLEGTSRSLGIFAATAFNSGTSATAWFEVNAKYNVITGHVVGARITNRNNAGTVFGVAHARVHATHNHWGTGTTSPHELVEDVINMPGKASISFSPWLPNTELAGHNGVYGRGDRELSDLAELPGFFIQREAADLIEASRSSFDLKLSAEPARDLRVRFGSDNPDLSFSPASVTFTASDWNTWQTVTVSAARDEDVEDEVTAVWGVSDDDALAGGLHPFFNTRVLDEKLRGAQHLINRLASSIDSVTVRGGDSVLLAVVPYGRQDIVDDALIDGKTDVVWSVEEGSGTFSEAEPSLDADSDPDDREIIFTAPDAPGTYTVHATLASCGIDTSEDCRTSFKVTVLRSDRTAEQRVAPRNPSGEIPAILVDSEGRQYEVFTPEDGGSFIGEDFSIEVPPAAVPNDEIIGISIAEMGVASNVGKPHHQYTLGGQRYMISAVDGTGSEIASYVLNEPAEVCLPMPAELRGNIRDIAVVAVNPDDTLTILSARLKVGGPSLQVCGNLSSLPAVVAVGSAGAPEALPTEIPDEETEMLPDTGGYAPSSNAALMLLMLVAGLTTAGLGLGAALSRRLNERVMVGRSASGLGARSGERAPNQLRCCRRVPRRRKDDRRWDET